ncbi:MAG: hypothetical protein HKN72_13740 [Gemmatimonadetes bacterium]|nr:hypothetical protein [Gemmatimonadota bacterium]NNF14288.1 hypothetical protein [Gemmatimonadota bacterium]NNL29656.1 hypothetical protein [Gemmatimonadota bacterium]
MTYRYFLGVALVAVLALVAPASVDAQEPQPAAGPAGDTELVFEREVFSYPSFTRRNPFRPLLGAAGGVRFEQLSLIGIMYSSDPASSVAVLSTGGVQVAEDGTMSPVDGDAYYLKVGDNIGNTTVVEIRRDAVVVDVEVFDSVEREIMNFVSRRQGGSS